MVKFTRPCSLRQTSAPRVYFNRDEILLLLALYSRRVTRGEWRDYAIDHAAECAVFSVFRNSCERPLFRVIKYAGSPGPCNFGVYGGVRRLASGMSLPDVLRVFDRMPHLVVLEGG